MRCLVDRVVSYLSSSLALGGGIRLSKQASPGCNCLMGLSPVMNVGGATVTFNIPAP